MVSNTSPTSRFNPVKSLSYMEIDDEPETIDEEEQPIGEKKPSLLDRLDEAYEKQQQRERDFDSMGDVF